MIKDLKPTDTEPPAEEKGLRKLLTKATIQETRRRPTVSTEPRPPELQGTDDENRKLGIKQQQQQILLQPGGGPKNETNNKENIKAKEQQIEQLVDLIRKVMGEVKNEIMQEIKGQITQSEGLKKEVKGRVKEDQ